MSLKKRWNSLPYAVKGILIAFVLTFIYASLIYSIILIQGQGLDSPIYDSGFVSPLLGEYFPSSFIFCLIFYSLIGLALGGIYSLIFSKSKKK